MFTPSTPETQSKETKNRADVKQNSEVRVLKGMRIRVDRFTGHLEKSTQIQKRDKNKPVVAIVGKTGAGKSSLINALLGHKMGKDAHNNIVCVDSEGAKIGHSKTDSQTTYPEMFLAGSRYLVDCPGWDDSRARVEPEIPLIIDFGVRRLLRGNVNGIIVVIDINSFRSSRAKDFKDVANALNDLIVDPTALNQSVVFVISKGDPLKKEEDRALVSEILEHQKKTVTTEYEEVDIEVKSQSDSADPEEVNVSLQILKGEQKQRLELLQTLELMKTATIIFSNLEDSGETVANIHQFLDRAPLVPQKYIKRTPSDKYAVIFNELFLDLVGDASKKLREILEIPGTIQQKEAEAKAAQETAASCSHQVSCLTNSEESNSIEGRKLQRSTLAERLKSIQGMITKMGTEVDKLRQDKKKLVDEFSGLDTNKETLLWESPLFTQALRKYLASWTWAECTFDCPSEAPYVREQEIVSTKGKFTQLSVKREKGIYQSIYKSGWGEDGYARVRIYCENRHLPENAMRIKELNLLIARCEPQIDEARQESQRLENQWTTTNDTLSVVNGSVARDEAQLKNKISTLNQGLSLARDKEAQVKREITFQHQHMRKLLPEIQENIRLYRVFRLIIEDMQMQSVTLNLFVGFLKKFETEMANLVVVDNPEEEELRSRKKLGVTSVPELRATERGLNEELRKLAARKKQIEWEEDRAKRALQDVTAALKQLGLEPAPLEFVIGETRSSAPAKVTEPTAPAKVIQTIAKANVVATSAHSQQSAQQLPATPTPSSANPSSNPSTNQSLSSVSSVPVSSVVSSPVVVVTPSSAQTQPSLAAKPSAQSLPSPMPPVATRSDKSAASNSAPNIGSLNSGPGFNSVSHLSESSAPKEQAKSSQPGKSDIAPPPVLFTSRVVPDQTKALAPQNTAKPLNEKTPLLADYRDSSQGGDAPNETELQPLLRSSAATKGDRKAH